jgi:hypothetical protein
MSFKDLGNKDAAPHVDTPAQAEARAQAVADLKAKADAKAAKAAAQRQSKASEKPAVPASAANQPKGGPAKG